MVIVRANDGALVRTNPGLGLVLSPNPRLELGTWVRADPGLGLGQNWIIDGIYFAAVWGGLFI